MNVSLSVLVVLMLLIAIIVRFVLPSARPAEARTRQSGYRRRKFLFTKAEWSFYNVLKLATAEKSVVLAKVRVADVIEPQKTPNRQEWQKLFNRISSKHFDFVLCAPETGEVIAAIELDDSSHTTERRRDRDAFLDEACDSADLSLIRIPVRPSYDVQEIRTLLRAVLADVA